jgi:hypothetical protein
VDYSEVPSWLQCLRGPFTLEAALDVYDKHLGPLPGQNGDSAGSLGPGYAKASQLGNSMITVRKVMREPGRGHAGMANRHMRRLP